MKQRERLWVWLALGAVVGLVATAAADETVFARVNGTVISVDRYEVELNRAVREKFYHRRPPEGQMDQLRREVGDSLIDRVLLLAEARQRRIEPDAEKNRKALFAFEARNRANLRWQQLREQLFPLLVQSLQEESLLEQLERSVREVPAAGTEQARAYFDAHPDAFTEPQRLRLSVILLKIDPGAPQAERDKTLEQAKLIRAQLAEGGDFAALAREHSGDESAPRGGDMGYVHRGMLAESVHAELERLADGALSEPIALLEGVGIFRLDERHPPRLRSFEESKERAAGLWQRERAERQWREFKAGLRSVATVEVVDRSRYPPVEASK